jgi:hypothetical protein
MSYACPLLSPPLVPAAGSLRKDDRPEGRPMGNRRTPSPSLHLASRPFVCLVHTHGQVVQRLAFIPAHMSCDLLLGARIVYRYERVRLKEERCRPMSREPALEVEECPLTRHRPQVRRVTHTHTAAWYRTVRVAKRNVRISGLL